MLWKRKSRHKTPIQLLSSTNVDSIFTGPLRQRWPLGRNQKDAGDPKQRHCGRPPMKWSLTISACVTGQYLIAANNIFPTCSAASYCSVTISWLPYSTQPRSGTGFLFIFISIYSNQPNPVLQVYLCLFIGERHWIHLRGGFRHPGPLFSHKGKQWLYSPLLPSWHVPQVRHAIIRFFSF